MTGKKFKVYQKLDGYNHYVLIENGENVGLEYDKDNKNYKVVPENELLSFKRCLSGVEGVLLDEEDVLPVLEQARKLDRVDEKPIGNLIKKHLEAIISAPAA